jgi:hypothetical protein
MSWTRVLLVIVGLFIALVVACVAISIRSSMHRTYVAEGNIEVRPPGPPGVTAPAVICMWANGYKVATPEVAKDPESGHPYILCSLDTPTSVPFSVSRYSNTGSGFLIGAYLVSIPGGHPACANATGRIEVENAAQLVGLCNGPMPPRSEVALMAPFNDDDGRPTRTVRVAITKAE